MITPDYLEQVMSQAQNTLNGASERIIQTLARRLEATITRYGKNDLIPTSLNEILNLEEVGMTYAEVQKEVEEALPQIRDQVREAFIKGAEKMNEYYGGGVRDTYEEGKEQPKTEPKEEPKNPVKPPLPENDYDFPDFVATTGYGNMLGLCGINCRHTFSMFFPNLQDSTPDVIDEKANRKKYQAEQQARAMERQIRAKKQALSAYQAVSDEIGKAKKQALVNEINSLIKQYQNFCRTNSVSMTEWRLATYDSHASFTKPRNNAKATPNASNMSGAMKKKLEEVYRRTNGDIYNICQTTAPSTQDTFINACDDAFMNIQMGMSLNEAISRAIDQVAEKGVSCVYYNSGRVDKMEVALARAIRTGINQANAQLVLMKCAELGIDYVKVSAHYGARVTKQNDYTNHSWWQGKVYKLNWSNKALNGFKSTNNPTDTEKATEQPETAQEYANNAQTKPTQPQKNYYARAIFEDNAPLNKKATFELKVDGYSEECLKAIQEISAKIVKKGHEHNKEYAYAIDAVTGVVICGEEGVKGMCMDTKFLDGIKESASEKVVVIHNHTDNGIFSLADIDTTLQEEKIVMSVVACNNGDMHYITDKLCGDMQFEVAFSCLTGEEKYDLVKDRADYDIIKQNQGACRKAEEEEFAKRLLFSYLYFARWQ